MAVAGFVPSLKKTGILKPSEGASKTAVLFSMMGPAAKALTTDITRGLQPLFDVPDEEPDQLIVRRPGPPTPPRTIAAAALTLPSGTRVSERHQLTHMQAALDARNAVLASQKPVQETMKLMDETERALRFGMFLMSLMFYRILNQVSSMRRDLTGTSKLFMANRTATETALVALKDRDNIVHALDSGADWTERSKMRQADKLADSRRAKLAFVQAKAVAGFAARAAKAADIARRAAQAHQKEMKKRAIRYEAARTIQRMWRATMARKRVSAELWALHFEREQQKRYQIAAILIQAVWRGHVARVIATDLKAELQEFIKMLRRRVDREIMDAYYKANPMEGVEKNVRDVVADAAQAQETLDVRKQRGVHEQDLKQNLGEREAKINDSIIMPSALGKVFDRFNPTNERRRVHKHDNAQHHEKVHKKASVEFGSKALSVMGSVPKPIPIVEDTSVLAQASYGLPADSSVTDDPYRRSRLAGSNTNKLPPLPDAKPAAAARFNPHSSVVDTVNPPLVRGTRRLSQIGARASQSST
jgi:hypothetical protein